MKHVFSEIFRESSQRNIKLDISKAQSREKTSVTDTFLLPAFKCVTTIDFYYTDKMLHM